MKDQGGGEIHTHVEASDPNSEPHDRRTKKSVKPHDQRKRGNDTVAAELDVLLIG